VRKTRPGKSHDYRDVIVFEKLRFQTVFRPHENEKPAFSNSSGLKSVFEKFRFLDGLVWTLGLAGEIIKAAFSNFSGVVWTLPQELCNRPVLTGWLKFFVDLSGCSCGIRATQHRKSQCTNA